MNPELIEEIDFTCEMLVKSGFFDGEEILEILEEQFMDEDVDFNKIAIDVINASNSNFSILEKAFSELSKNNIIAIHNCGYDIEDGVNDAFELFVHLRNNKFFPDGFCFYTFEDIEEAICHSKLKITFGDFEESENKCLEIGKKVFEILSSFDLNINWDGTVNSQIEIYDFSWDKKYNSSKEYEMEGAFKEFVDNHRC